MTIWQRKLKYRFCRVKPPYRTANRHRVSKWVALGLVLILCGWAFFSIEARIGPLAQQAAISELNGTITKDINQVVKELLARQSDEEHLIQKQVDENGKVLSMSMNYHAVNQLKSDLAIEVQQRLDTLSTIRTSVPVGMLFSDTLLTGFGIPIPIQVFVTNAIEVEIEDEFTSAGINQTRHKLMVTVTVPARVAGVLRYEDTEIITQVPLHETILVGDVPQTYLSR